MEKKLTPAQAKKISAKKKKIRASVKVLAERVAVKNKELRARIKSNNAVLAGMVKASRSDIKALK